MLGEVDTVAAFRTRSESEKLLRLQVIQQTPVGGRHGVVEFIDDDDIEEVRFQLFNAERGQRLDRGEDVLPLFRLVFPHIEFAEGTVLHDIPVGAHRLFEDFLAVSDEEQLEIAAGGFA
jgi:hypothetical protein